jgi:hypothetical protein
VQTFHRFWTRLFVALPLALLCVIACSSPSASPGVDAGLAQMDAGNHDAGADGGNAPGDAGVDGGSTASDAGADAGLFALGPGSPIDFVQFDADPAAIATGDFNGDGKIDMAVPGLTNQLVILLGNGDGTFSNAAGSPIYLPAAPFTVLPFAVTAGDYNGDGTLDLAVACGDGTVRVFFGDGKGGFNSAPESPIQFGFMLNALAQGDFNGDGLIDLAVLGVGNGTVTVLFGNGNGFSSDAGDSYTVGPTGGGTTLALMIEPNTSGNGGPSAVATGDFNSDGNLDLAVANADDSMVRILLGDGTGHFSMASGSPFSVGISPTSLASADFDGDGELDLVATNSMDATLSVLRGNGNGAFSAFPGSPISVAATRWATSMVTETMTWLSRASRTAR